MLADPAMGSAGKDSVEWSAFWRQSCSPQAVGGDHGVQNELAEVMQIPDQRWVPFSSAFHRQGEGCSERLYLRSPEGAKARYLFFYALFVSVDLFQGGELIFSTADRQLGGFPAVFYDAGRVISGERLYIRIDSIYPRVGLGGVISATSFSDILRKILFREIFTLFVALFAVYQGFSSLFKALLRLKKEEKIIFFWYGIFALFSGIWMGASLNLLVLFDIPILVFFPLTISLFHIWITALCIMTGKLFYERSSWFLRSLAAIHALLIPLHPVLIRAVLLHDRMDLLAYDLEIFDPAITVISAVAIVFITLKWAYLNRQREWMVAVGLAILILVGIFSTVSSLLGIYFQFYDVTFLGYVLLMAYVRERGVAGLEKRLERRSLTLKEREEELRKERLKLQQSRMNPHFLLNSLGMFYAFLEKGKVDMAKEALLFLSDHYRFLTDRSFDTLIALSREMEFCKNYLKLQSLRFGDSFSYTIQENQLNDFMIPPLTIQPLVENAIQHGIRNIDEPGEIRIELSGDERELIVKIIDNGAGLREYYNTDRSLSNIRNRLLYYYHSAELKLLNRSESRGTEVRLHFSGFVSGRHGK